jgi:L-2-hydroxyglutarate oxidase LhgO
MDHIDTCVIGAGVVGLAVSRVLAGFTSDLLVLDTEINYGQGISSRNSEVIHAGIYYPADSLKASLCVRGKHLLYEYCESRHVAYNRCGKLIVATQSEEEAALEEVLVKAEQNGVEDIQHWSAEKIATEEPQVKAHSGLFSPSTGIVSAHELMTAYLADIEDAGGSFVGGTHVLSVGIEKDKFVIHCRAGGEQYEFSCRVLINSGGLGAQQLAGSIDGLATQFIPPLHYCRGNYFTLAAGNPFTHLIYPVPEKSGAGLGVHATIDLGGQVKFGPDVEYIDSIDYSVSLDRLPQYYEAIRRYYPDLKDGELNPGYAGIRPKLQGPGELPADFVIQSVKDHGVPGLIQLFGIESPGLTSSMAIAEYIGELFGSDCR